MTLVVLVEVEGVFAAFSDLMLSREDAFDGMAMVPPLLKKGKAVPYEFDAVLGQKMIPVPGGGFLCWSGDYEAASDLCAVLAASGDPWGLDEPGWDRHLRMPDAFAHALSGFLIYLKATHLRSATFGQRREAQIGGARFVAFGSGATDFLQFAEIVAAKDGPYQRDNLLTLYCSFGVQALLGQRLSSYAVANRWGGGFDILLTQKGSLVKLPDVLWLTCLLRRTDAGKLAIGGAGWLMLSTLGTGAAIALYRSPAFTFSLLPVQSPMPSRPLSVLSANAKWMCFGVMIEEQSRAPATPMIRYGMWPIHDNDHAFGFTDDEERTVFNLDHPYWRGVLTKFLIGAGFPAEELDVFPVSASDEGSARSEVTHSGR